MNPAGDRVLALFAELVELDDDARAARLAEEDLADPVLGGELAALLDADRRAGANPMLSPGWLARLVPPASSRVGSRVGDFELRELIASGGMGDVYLGERVVGEFEQRVAIKLVRADRAGPATLARFAVERQILANLRHPGIATLFGGGVVDGRPYLVMEWIDGVPLDRYVADRSLDRAARLDLFLAICDPVEHAHAQLVVHRDLKPDNVLVTAEGEVKLLDFGVATALQSDDEAGTVRAMTPAYAAPEVLAGRASGTTADVYALGVMLHELLTGRRPDPAAGEVSGISHDLDAICRRALAPAPDQRYRSVAALSADLAASRAHRPVAARGGGLAEAMFKFHRRHRVGVSIAALVIGAVVALVLFYTGRLAAERDRARAAARRAEATSDLVVGLFAGVDPAETRGEPITPRDLLARGRARLEADLADQPAERARLLVVLGRVHTSLGQYPEAEAVLAEAVPILRQGGASDRLAEALVLLGHAHREQTELDEADRVMREALSVAEARHGAESLAAAGVRLDLAAVSIDRGAFDQARALASSGLAIQRARGAAKLTVARTLATLGEVEIDRGDYPAAESMMRESLATSVAGLGTVHPETARATIGLAIALRRQERYDEAEGLYRQALAIDQKLYAGDHPDVAHALNHLGRLYTQRGADGDDARAEEYLRRGLEMRRRLYGADHAAVGASLSALAQHLAKLGRLDDAIPLARESVDITRRLYGESHSYVAGSLGVLARIVEQRGDRPQAIALYRRALGIARALPEPDVPRIVRLLGSLATALCATGARAEAAQLLAEATALHPEPSLRAQITRAQTTCR